MKKLIIICLSVIALISCEERRLLDDSGFEKRIVLNAIISTDSIWEVNLQYTKSIVDKSPIETIDNASIKVQNLTNGQSFFLDQDKDGAYTRELNPVEGHYYALSAEVDGYLPVTAKTYVPLVLEVNVISLEVEDESGSKSLEIDIEITDDPNEDNYYVWEITPVFRSEQSLPNASKEIPAVYTESAVVGNGDEVTSASIRTDILIENTFALIKNDEQVLPNEFERTLSKPAFLSDKDFKEGIINNRLVLNSKLLEDISEGADENGGEEASSIESFPRFQLSVMAVSDELYQFLLTSETYKQSDPRPTNVSSPLGIYSNVQNGLGIFGGYNIKTFNIF